MICYAVSTVQNDLAPQCIATRSRLSSRLRKDHAANRGRPHRIGKCLDSDATVSKVMKSLTSRRPEAYLPIAPAAPEGVLKYLVAARVAQTQGSRARADSGGYVTSDFRKEVIVVGVQSMQVASATDCKHRGD